MGNKNFDDDDFNFEDFDDFGSNEEDDKDLRSGVGDDFEFDNDMDLEGEDFEDIDLGDELGEDFEFEDVEEEGGGGGPNRTFVILAGAMIVLFIVGLIAVVILAVRPTGPSEVQMTASAVVAFNSTQSVFATQTAEANAILFMTQTAIANASPTPTPTATLVPPSPTNTLAGPVESPTLDETQRAAFAAETAAAEGTRLAGLPTESPTPTSGVSSAEAVQLTATALALLFQTPTAEIQITQPSGGPLQQPQTALPETGLFDDVFGNGQGFGAFLLMAFGLVGVIVVSRRLRTWNK